MNQNSYKAPASPALMLGTAFLVLAGTLTAFSPFKAHQRARMAESISNGRQIKLILDIFAADNDGVYPSDESAELYKITNKDKTSNGYFTQLIASGNTNSEKVFWVRGAQVCNAEEPDDVVTLVEGVIALPECLKAGDCGWAYMRKQTNTDNPSRPILVGAYLPGTKKFDPNLHEGKVITICINGSGRAIEPNPKGIILLQGEDALSAKSDFWKATKTDPANLLAQPKPSKAAQKRIADAAKAAKPEGEEAVKEKE